MEKLFKLINAFPSNDHPGYVCICFDEHIETVPASDADRLADLLKRASEQAKAALAAVPMDERKPFRTG